VPANSTSSVAPDKRDPTRRVLVGGVGYTNLRDLSFGPLLVERLRERRWPAGVEIEDLSAGAIHEVHVLQSREPYDLAILIAGVRRGGTAGTIRAYRWDHAPRSTDEVQGRVSEALVGIIGLDTLLIVLDHFGALPADTRIVEVEPDDEGWGPGLSAPVDAVLDEVDRLVCEQMAQVAA
jgi:hydrogenase maturation protease